MLSRGLPDNLFGFAHLGIEIFMKSGPNKCEVKGANPNHAVPGGLEVHIGSSFTPEQVMAQRQAAVKSGKNVKKIYLAMQAVPLLGRLAAHATTNVSYLFLWRKRITIDRSYILQYFDQLDQIALGGCVDRK